MTAVIDLLTLEEVAEICRAPVASVRAWCRDGRLHSVRPGRKRLVHKHDLDRFLLGDIRGHHHNAASDGSYKRTVKP